MGILKKCKDYKQLVNELDSELLNDIDKVLEHYDKWVSKIYDNNEDFAQRNIIGEYKELYGNNNIIDWFECLISTEEFIEIMKTNLKEMNI